MFVNIGILEFPKKLVSWENKVWETLNWSYYLPLIDAICDIIIPVAKCIVGIKWYADFANWILLLCAVTSKSCIEYWEYQTVNPQVI